MQFEERIRENEKHNAKFSFLNPNDPYHAYYQYKIADTKDGKGKYKNIRPLLLRSHPIHHLLSLLCYVMILASRKAELKEIKVEIKDEGPPPKVPPKEPPKFEFMADMPAISAQDL